MYLLLTFLTLPQLSSAAASVPEDKLPIAVDKQSPQSKPMYRTLLDPLLQESILLHLSLREKLELIFADRRLASQVLGFDLASQVFRGHSPSALVDECYAQLNRLAPVPSDISSTEFTSTVKAVIISNIDCIQKPLCMYLPKALRSRYEEFFEPGPHFKVTFADPDISPLVSSVYATLKPDSYTIPINNLGIINETFDRMFFIAASQKASAGPSQTAFIDKASGLSVLTKKNVHYWVPANRLLIVDDDKSVKQYSYSQDDRHIWFHDSIEPIVLDGKYKIPPRIIPGSDARSFHVTYPHSPSLFAIHAMTVGVNNPTHAAFKSVREYEVKFEKQSWHYSKDLVLYGMSTMIPRGVFWGQEKSPEYVPFKDTHYRLVTTKFSDGVYTIENNLHKVMLHSFLTHLREHPAKWEESAWLSQKKEELRDLALKIEKDGVHAAWPLIRRFMSGFVCLTASYSLGSLLQSGQSTWRLANDVLQYLPK